MPNKTFSEYAAGLAFTPSLAGTEGILIVKSGATKQVLTSAMDVGKLQGRTTSTSPGVGQIPALDADSAVVANLKGNVIGDVTGDVTGNLTGRVVNNPGAGPRQAVLSGKTTNGYADFITAGTGLSANVAATSTPLYLSFAGGFDALGAVDYYANIAADFTVSSLTANTTNFLYVDRATDGTISSGKSVFEPVYNTLPLANLSNASQVIVNSTYSGFAASNLYDGNVATAWAAAEVSSNQLGVSYFGQDFGVSTKVTHLTIYTWNVAAGNISSVKSQYWDGGAWVDIATHSLATTVSIWITLAIPDYPGGTKFRLLANANLSGGSAWCVAEARYQGYSVDQHWFDLNTFKMKRWSGTEWEEKQRVFLGEAVTGASSVSSVVTYALQGNYDSGLFVGTGGTTYSKTHNLGVIPRSTVYVADDITGTNERLAVDYHQNSGGYGYMQTVTSRNSLLLYLATNGTYNTTPAGLLTTYYRIISERGW